MIRLGIRLALADGRRAALTVGLTATAVAIGIAILLFAISFQPAVGDRDSRQAWRQPLVLEEGQPKLLMAVLDDRYQDQVFVRVLVARLTSDAPAPPGVAAPPGPGESYISPALADLLARTPADQLAPRLGKVMGVIGPAGLRSPQELIAVIGLDEKALTDGQVTAGMGTYYAAPAAAFRTESLPPRLPPLGLLILVLAVIGALTPVAVFVATATRMAAANRELRLAALRLVGATPGQVARLAVAEALLYTMIGTPIGIALFFLARPYVALIPLDGATWWPDSIQPPLLQAAALILVVQVVGAAAALFGMRRLSISPLGVQQRVTPPAPGAIRIVPALAGVVVLLVCLFQLRGGSVDNVVPLAIVGASFAAIIGGIAFAGPWLTVVVGRVLGRIARGPATLLAARRLADDPRGSFGAIAGVIMAVFVASAFFSITAYVNQQAYGPQAPLAAGRVLALLPQGASGSAAIGSLKGLSGVQGVVEVREAMLVSADGSAYEAWIVPCDQLIGPGGALDMASSTCGPSAIQDVNPAPGESLAGDFTVEIAATWDPSAPAVGPKIHISAGDASPLLTTARDGSYMRKVVMDPALLGSRLTDIPVSHIYVATDGSSATVERVRAAVQGAAPTAWILPAGDIVATVPQFAEVGRIVSIGLIGSLAMAGCSLAVATLTGLLQRRRQFVFLRSAGLPMSQLRALVLIQAGVPLVIVSGFSALLGVGVAQAILRLSTTVSVPLPEVSLVFVLAASMLVAMSVVAATLPAVDRLTRPQSIRSE
jgi:hypothetical protein